MSRGAGALAGLLLTIAGLAAGFALKYPCLGDGPARKGDEYRRDCYSDIAALYGPRRAVFNPPDRPVPFEDHALAYRDNNFEYPAATGLFVSGVNMFVPSDDRDGFFGANAAGLALVALGGAAALGAYALERRRLVLYAVTPTAIAYAFHNWDLLPVGLLALGLVAYARRLDVPAGVLIGLGAAAKVFPVVVLPALVLARWHQRRRGDAVALAVAAVAGFAVPNLIVLAYAGFDGWVFPWRSISTRLPTLETAWYFLARHADPSVAKTLYNWAGAGYVGVVQIVSVGIMATGSGLLLWREYCRETFRPFAAALGCLIVFLISTKVFSVQYSLWLVPLLVAVRIPWHAALLYSLADMFVLAAIWAVGVALLDGTPTSGYFGVLEVAVWIRYAGLVYLLWWSRRSRDLLATAGATPATSSGETPAPVGDSS